jgi:hypothetical protein
VQIGADPRQLTFTGDERIHRNCWSMVDLGELIARDGCVHNRQKFVVHAEYADELVKTLDQTGLGSVFLPVDRRWAVDAQGNYRTSDQSCWCPHVVEQG